VKPVRKRLADGSVKLFYHHRKTGIRLPDDPTSPEFTAALNADETPGRLTIPDSIADLVERYRKSPEFTQLAPKTRKDYGRYLDEIKKSWATCPWQASGGSTSARCATPTPTSRARRTTSCRCCGC
jgi:hypothetical protein